MNPKTTFLGFVSCVCLGFCTHASAVAEDLNALYADGVKFFEAKDYRASADKLKQFCAEGKNDARLPEAKLKLGDSLAGMGMLVQATATYEEWLKENGSATNAAQVRLKYARSFESAGDWHRAIAEYKQYLLADPDSTESIELRVHIAATYRDILSSPKDAIREYEEIFKRYPNTPRKLEIKMELAEIYLQQGWLAQARDAHREIAREFPQSPEGKRSLAAAAWLSEDGGLKDYSSAVVSYKEYTTLYPKADDLYHVFVRMGMISRDKLGQPTNAVDWFNQALNVKADASVLWERCKALAMTDNKEEVLKSFHELIDKFPDSAQAIEAYNVLWRRQNEWGQTEEAAKILNQAVTRYPNYLPFRYELGHLYREMEKWDDAIAAYGKVAELEPGYSKGEVYDLLTDCYLKKKDLSGAEKLLKEVLGKFQQNPEISVNCLWNLATQVYEAQNNDDAAIGAFFQILMDYPGHAYAAPDQAPARVFAAYNRKKDLEGAIVEIDKLARQQPDSPNIRMAQAEIVRYLKEAGQAQKAIDYAKIMLLNDESDAAAGLATVYMAECYEMLENLREELVTYTKVHRFRELSRAAAIHGLIDQLKRDRLPNKREDGLYFRTSLKEWAMKEISAEEAADYQTYGEDHAKKGDWLLGNVEGWEKVTSGTNLGKRNGYVRLVTQIDATGAIPSVKGLEGTGETGTEKESMEIGAITGETNYILKFESVGGECHLYVDGKIVGKNQKPGVFQQKFESAKKEGKITIALLISAGGEQTGILKPAYALAPRPLEKENILLSGLGYHVAGEHQDALNRYNQFLRKLPPDATDREVVKTLQNRIYGHKNDLESLAGNAPANPSLEYQILIAELFQRDGKPDKAIQAYEKAGREFVDSRGAAVALARAYEVNGRHREAVKAWLDILDRWSNVGNIESYRRYVVWYAANQGRDISYARELARTFNQPPSLYWLTTLGDLHYNYPPQDYAQSVNLYFQAYSQDEESWYLASRVFDSVVAEKNIDRAKMFADMWSKKHPGHSQTPSMIFRIGKAYQGLGNHPQALEYYSKVQNDYPFSDAATDAVRNAIELPGEESLAMLDKWVKTHPGDERAAGMYWALGQRYEGQKTAEKAIPLYQKIWSDFQKKEPENFRAANRLANLFFGGGDGSKKSEGIAIFEQILDRFGRRPEPEIRSAWARLSEYYRGTDPARFIAHNQRLVSAFPGQREALDAQIATMGFQMEKGDYLDAAIQMQRLIHGMPKNNPVWWDRIVEIGHARMNDKRYGEAAVMFKSLLRNNEGFDRQKVREAEQVMADALSKSGDVLVKIDPNLPEASILWGNIFANAGEDKLAWVKYKENEELFQKYQHLVSAAYIKVIVKNLLGEKRIKDAINICRRFMISTANATHLKDSEKATVQLLLGDAYFRDERYEIARDEYQTVITMWPNTREAIDARFKVGETLMEQKIFAKAEEIFTDLSTYKDEEICARAHLMLGLLFHVEGEMEKAEEKFKEVLALAPKNETADMIMFRLGVVYQTTGKYREALDTLRLIGAYSGDSKQVVEPGAVLRIRLSDRNLQIVKGNSRVPIVVTTTAGDAEVIFLTQSFAGPGLYVAGIETELGKPVANDKKLQVVGKDIITYDYHPNFKKDMVIEERLEKPAITIAADGDLKFSSTEIKEEEQEVKIDPSMFAEQKRTGTRLFRTGKEIAPGNLCYMQVRDPDRDFTDEKDMLSLSVEAVSGDIVNLKIEETDSHSGVFRGSVKTGIKPPDALASDSAEGHEARFAIDGDSSNESAWIGRMDGRAPKWLVVDLKDIQTFDKIVWNRGKGFKPGDERTMVRYSIDVARKKDEWFPVAAQPEATAPLRSLAIMENPDGEPVPEYLRRAQVGPTPLSDGSVQTAWQGVVKTDPKSKWTIDLDLGQVCTLERFTLRDGNPQLAVKSFRLFMEAKSGLKPIGDEGWANLDMPPGSPKDFPIIARAKCRYLRLLVTETNGDHPEIGDLDIQPKLIFEHAAAQDGLGMAFTFAPVDARFIRFLIKEFRGDAPALAHIEISGAGKIHIPIPGLDIHSLATNDVLEVSPGDTITAAYTDEVNIDPGSHKVYRESLFASYFNGGVACIRNEWYEDTSGNRRKEELTVGRLNVNEEDQRLVISITDYDADKTDGIDKIPFRVVSRSTGQELQLEAKETGPYTGVFTKEVDVTMRAPAAPAAPAGGAKEGAAPAKEIPLPPGTLRVVDGDIVRITYWDEENTDPGNRTERFTEIEETKPKAGTIEIASTLGTIAAPDKNEKPVVLITMDQPLALRVVDPDMALDTGSKVIVNLETTPGGDTAKVECKMTDLERGLFSGSIRLALGDKESPDEIVEAAGFESEFTDPAAAKKKKKDQPTIPVLNVMGRDVISATYVDQTTPESQTKVERMATARIITDGTIGFYDDEYDKTVEAAHLGDKLFIKVEDGDADTTEERDTVDVLVTSTYGDQETIKVPETLSHSGIFNTAVPLVPPQDGPKPGNGLFEADFGDEVKVVYTDERNLDRDEKGKPAGPAKRTAVAKVVVGTDGALTAFGIKFPSEEMAIETQFHIGECFYFLGKEHIELKNKNLGLTELNEGQEILRELILHFPGNKTLDQAAYLLANLAQEQEKFHEAIKEYENIVKTYPKSVISPDAQYKVGICWEKMDHMDNATEQYVILAYKFPESPLVGDAMIRIGLYFFNKKNYKVATQVFAKFVEKYPDHSSVQKVAFKMGLCYILSEQYAQAGEHFREFVEKYTVSELKPAALYWAGDAYLKAANPKKSYQMFKRLIWDFPEEKWAKYARGRLTAPVFDRIAEEE